MAHSLLAFAVGKRKDLVLLRQRSRQIAGMLGYEAQDQAAIAAAAFAITSQTFQQHGHCVVHFQVVDNAFHVFPVRERRAPAVSARFDAALLDNSMPLRLEKPLPVREPPLAETDLAFVAQELNRLTPPDLFAEIERQNQELLHVLMELRSCQAQLSETAARHANTSAA